MLAIQKFGGLTPSERNEKITPSHDCHEQRSALHVVQIISSRPPPFLRSHAFFCAVLLISLQLLKPAHNQRRFKGSLVLGGERSGVQAVPEFRCKPHAPPDARQGLRGPRLVPCSPPTCWVVLSLDNCCADGMNRPAALVFLGEQGDSSLRYRPVVVMRGAFPARHRVAPSNWEVSAEWRRYFKMS